MVVVTDRICNFLGCLHEESRESNCLHAMDIAASSIVSLFLCIADLHLQSPIKKLFMIVRDCFDPICLFCRELLRCPNELNFGAHLTRQIIYHHKKIWNFLNFSSIFFEFFSKRGCR